MGLRGGLSSLGVVFGESMPRGFSNPLRRGPETLLELQYHSIEKNADFQGVLGPGGLLARVFTRKLEAISELQKLNLVGYVPPAHEL